MTLISVTVIGGLVGAGLSAAGWTVFKKHKEHIAALVGTEHPAPTGTETSADAEIQVSYNMGYWLPIVVPPYTITHILAFRENRTATLSTINNNQDKNWIWPSSPKGVEPSDPIGLCEISNHGEKILFNILTRLMVEFYEHRKHGKFVQEVLASVNQDVAIESLKPGDSFPIYLVNQSSYDVMVKLPDRVNLEIQGKRGKFWVPLKPRNLIQPLDQLPPFLTPSSYIWVGDAIKQKRE